MLHNFSFENVISLGVDCRVRFQISRYFAGMRAVPPATGALAEGAALTEILKGTHLFDWNITWFGDVIRAFEAGFDSLFVKENLKANDKRADVAVDGLYAFRYFHLFHAEPGVPFERMVEEQYEHVAPKVFYLRDKLITHLSSANPTIYVRCEATEADAKRFCEMMATRYPAHRFHLVVVEMRDETQGFTVETQDFSVYKMSRRVSKPANAAWSGDNDEWTALFNRICDTTQRLGA